MTPDELRSLLSAHAARLAESLAGLEPPAKPLTLELEAGGWEVTVTVSRVRVIADEMTPCERDVLLTLAEATQRLTTMRVLEAMDDADRHHGESTIKMALALLVKSGLIANSREIPRGYYLPENTNQ